ncbi:hypothetical protein NC651_009745 [Populus alba x Populus x berolinensis]|nr:hypothetical protein NC651_009745 [Populus alba x Populus x berolinensis]
MGNIHRSFLFLFSLIVIHVLMSSLLCLHHERKVQLLDRNQGTNVNKSNWSSIRDPRKAAETSLRKAPPRVFSNPTQNTVALNSLLYRDLLKWKRYFHSLSAFLQGFPLF